MASFRIGHVSSRPHRRGEEAKLLPRVALGMKKNRGERTRRDLVRPSLQFLPSHSLRFFVLISFLPTVKLPFSLLFPSLRSFHSADTSCRLDGRPSGHLGHLALRMLIKQKRGRKRFAQLFFQIAKARTLPSTRN